MTEPQKPAEQMTLGKLLVEMNKPADPKTIDVLKKSLKKWANKWMLKPGVALLVVGASNYITYLYAKGHDLQPLVNLGTAAALGVAAFLALRKWGK